MTTSGGAARPLILATVALITSTACDLVAEAGQMLVLGNRGTAFGSGGNSQRAPLPTVRVRPGGALIVEDADLFGGGIVVERADQPRYGSAGAGISLTRGFVRVQEGLVRGGPILVMVPADAFDNPAPAIDASSATIEISGGSIIGGGIASTVADRFAPALTAPALEAFDSRIRVTGGTFVAGTPSPRDPAAGAAGGPSFVAVDSDVVIRAGEFGEGIGIADGSARIFGGRGSSLSFLNSLPQSCSEIHGGQFQTLLIGAGRVLVFGSRLALAPGANPSVLTGTLEDGTPANLAVLQLDAGRVQLVPPGAPGCPLVAQRASENLAGEQTQGGFRNTGSVQPEISADGRFVTFISEASNLVENDGNGQEDVFIKDLDTGLVERASVLAARISSSPSRSQAFSSDGRFVAFASGLAFDPRAGIAIYDRTLRTAETVIVDPSLSAGEPSLNSDGRFLAFATGVVVFVLDRQTGARETISVSSTGVQGDGLNFAPAISGDGRFVAFASTANLAENDQNQTFDVFVRDRLLGTTVAASMDGSGRAGGGTRPAISADGRFVAFVSGGRLTPDVSDFGVNVFVRDLQMNVTERISTRSDTSGDFLAWSRPGFSPDGRFVSFLSRAPDLVSGDGNLLRDAFVFDRVTRRTTRVNVGPVEPDRTGSAEFSPALATAGSVIAFDSGASNLIEQDTNLVNDVFAVRLALP
jgi:Tol biopolymer transport system component